MKAVDTDVVAAIRQQVAAQVGEVAFDLWFRDNAKLSLTEQELVVGVPNLFFQEWLSSNFVPALRKAAETVIGRRLPVRLVVDGELFRRQRGQAGAAVAGGAQPGLRRRPAGPKLRQRPRERNGQTLENFVVGKRNRLAHVAARQLVQEPDGQYNPLVIYGGLGLGKTHLLRGIAHGVRLRHPQLHVVYVTAEAFTNAFLEAMRCKRLEPFRKRVRSADVLLVDDIHFLAAKRATQAELLHTYEALEAAGRQVVLTCERHPRQIADFSAELANRLMAGLMCRIEPPDYEHRISLLESKARGLGLRLGPEVLEFLAAQLQVSCGELIGAVNCLKAYAEAAPGAAIDLAATRQVLAESLRQSANGVSRWQVERAVCQALQVSSEQLHSRSRARSVCYPRMLAMYLMRKHTGEPYESIGNHFGGRNHSTVMSAMRKVQDWLDNGAAVRMAGQQCHVAELVRQIEQELK